MYEEPHHHRSRVWLRNKIESGEQFAAPRILLLEIPAALERQQRTQYRAAIEMKLRQVRIRWVTLDDTLIDRTVELTPIIKLKALDCLYAAVAEQMNAPLFTWDRNIVDAAPKAGIRAYYPA